MNATELITKRRSDMDRKEAIEVLRKYSPKDAELREALETAVPELKESEDERIKKALIRGIESVCKEEEVFTEGFTRKQIVSWLKKQGEQKPADKVEPKFKVGDWIVYCNEDVDLITGITETGYLINKGGYIPFICQGDMRLWTIKDAKDGDVLVGNYDNCKKPWIGIFKCISKDRPTTQFDSHCFLNSSHHIFTTPLSCDFYNQCKGHTIRYALPATKEQRDLLFQKMKEAGYEWDAEKKELRKIAQKPTDKTKIYDSMDDLIADALIEEIEGSELHDRDKYNLIHWIKSHRQNPAWSEEDEKILDSILCDIGIADKKMGGQPTYESKRNWLKSLKERCAWKPSEEQIMALRWVLNHIHYDSHKEEINGLLEQLLKLYNRGENR